MNNAAGLNQFEPYLLKRLQGCYLITGATGFLGSALVRTLRYLNETVWKENPSHLKLLVREPEHFLDTDNQITLRKYDPCQDLKNIGEVDYIIHCAGICDSRQFTTRPCEVLDVNLTSTQKLLEYACQNSSLRGMVFVSSGYIYSPDENQILSEDAFIFKKGDLTDFSMSYIVSKIASECYCKSAFVQKGVPVNIIRPFNIYGPGLNLTHGGILTEVLRAASSGQMTMKSDGRAVRNFVYVDDVVSSILYCLAAETYGESYNVCSDTCITVADLVELTLRMYRDRGMEVSFRQEASQSDLTSDQVNFFPENAKLKKLGWKESITLETGMKYTIDYYVNNVRRKKELPSIGFGTWKISDRGGVKSIYSALVAGFRYIDTAQLYGNEKEIGIALSQAIQDRIVLREDVFIGTKLENDIRGYRKTAEAIDRSLERLGLDYVDMFMLHWPKPRKYLSDWQEKNRESWQAFEEYVRRGKIRSLGVCNFLEHHLKPLLKNCVIKPCVNQLELHPYYWQDSAVAYCNANGIVVQSWSPIANGKCLGDERLLGIGKKYNKSIAQLCIKYSGSKGAMPLVKAASLEHQKQNLDLEWELEKSDIDKIMKMQCEIRVGRHPDDE